MGEVTGACFCCKFNGLLDTVSQLSASHQPDVILAEPVGSCTDLVSTVVEPLRRFYGEQFEVGPLAVLLKPEHGRKILSDTGKLGFSPKAAYIFLKQLEEADLVVVNKIDKLSEDQRGELVALIRQRYPTKRVLAASARTGDGLAELLNELAREGKTREKSLPIDYDVYAEGEAELGWLNCIVTLTSDDGKDFPLDEVAVDLVERLRHLLLEHDAEPAHLKVLAESEGESAIANLVSSDSPVELSLSAGVTVSHADLIVNARVAIAPEALSALVAQAASDLAQSRGLAHELTDLQSFRPGRPTPTHRITAG